MREYSVYDKYKPHCFQQVALMRFVANTIIVVRVIHIGDFELKHYQNNIMFCENFSHLNAFISLFKFIWEFRSGDCVLLLYCHHFENIGSKLLIYLFATLYMRINVNLVFRTHRSDFTFWK